MIFAYTLTIAAILGAEAGAIPAGIRGLLEASEKSRPSTIRSMKQNISSMARQKGIKDARAITEAKRQLADIEKGGIIVPLVPQVLEQGNVFRLANPLHVISVAGPSEMVVSTDAPVRVRPKIVGSRTNAIVIEEPYPGTEHTFWLKGISTAGIVDDKRFNSDGVFIVNGTKQLSFKTVFLVEKIEQSELDRYVAQFKEEKRQKKGIPKKDGSSRSK